MAQHPLIINGLNGMINAEEPGSSWESVWKAGLHPGEKFDIGNVSKPLAKLLQSLDVAGKRAFVPGCGRGYDVVAFATAGAMPAIGLEISDTAIASAEAYQAEIGLPPEVAAQAQVIKGDFFKYEPEGGPFDIGFDYTFLCALHPPVREQWADTWAKLIKPGGELVTLMFPVDPTKEGGPPFAVSPELYDELLPPAGFERTLLEKVAEEDSPGPRKGKEWLGRWRRV